MCLSHIPVIRLSGPSARSHPHAMMSVQRREPCRKSEFFLETVTLKDDAILARQPVLTVPYVGITPALAFGFKSVSNIQILFRVMNVL